MTSIPTWLGRHVLLQSLRLRANDLSAEEKFAGIAQIVATSEGGDEGTQAASASCSLTEEDVAYICRAVVEMTHRMAWHAREMESSTATKAMRAETASITREARNSMALLVRHCARGGMQAIVDLVANLVIQSAAHFSEREAWEEREDDAASFAVDLFGDADPDDDDDGTTANDSETQMPSTKKLMVAGMEAAPFSVTAITAVTSAMYTSRDWRETNAPFLDKHSDGIASSLATFMQFSCVPGRLTLLGEEVEAIFDVFGDGNSDAAISLMWASVASLPRVTAHEVGKLMFLCVIAEKLFSSNSAIKYSLDLWAIVMDGLKNTRSSSQRKRALHVIRIWLSSLKAGDSVPAGLVALPLLLDGKQGAEYAVLGSDDIENAHRWWKTYILVSETIEEKQIHIIRPLMPKLIALSQAVADGMSPISFAWVELLYRYMFQHERSSVRVLGITVSTSITFSRPDRLMSDAFLYQDLLKVAGLVGMYRPTTTAEETSDPPVPGSLLAPFYLSHFANVPTSNRCEQQRAFLHGVASHVKNTVPFLFLAEVMVQWNVCPDTWVGRTVFEALVRASKVAKSAQEPALRSATVNAMFHILMHNMQAAHPLQELQEGEATQSAHGVPATLVARLHEIAFCFTLVEPSDSFLLGDSLSTHVATWLRDILPQNMSKNAVSVAILQQFLSEETDAAPRLEEVNSTALLLLLLAQERTDFRSLLAVLADEINSLPTRALMPRKKKARSLALVSALVSLVVMTREGEMHGAQMMNVIFQEARQPQAPLAAAMEAELILFANTTQQSVFAYVHSVWREHPLAVLYSIDCLQYEAEALLTYAMFATAPVDTSEMQALALAWLSAAPGSPTTPPEKEDLGSTRANTSTSNTSMDWGCVVAAITLASLPQFHRGHPSPPRGNDASSTHATSSGECGNDAPKDADSEADRAIRDALDDLVLKVTSAPIPSRSLTADEKQAINAYTGEETARPRVPLSELRRFYSMFIWRALNALLHRHVYRGSCEREDGQPRDEVATASNDESNVALVRRAASICSFHDTFLLYSPIKTTARGKFNRATVARVIEHATDAIDGVYLEDSGVILVCVGLCIQHAMADALQEALIEQFARKALNFMYAESRRHGVSLSFLVNHSTCGLIFNNRTLALAAQSPQFFAFLSGFCAERLFHLALGDQGVERRGFLLPTALWITRFFQHSPLLLTNQSSNNRDGHSRGDAGDAQDILRLFLPLLIQVAISGLGADSFTAVSLAMVRYLHKHTDWVSVPVPPGVLTYLDSRVTRSVVLAFILKMPAALLIPMCEKLMDEERTTFEAMDNFHPNTDEHKKRFRCFQLLVICASAIRIDHDVSASGDTPSDDAVDDERCAGYQMLVKLAAHCTETIFTERLLSVRYLAEWVLMILIKRGVIEFSSLTPRLDDASVRPGYVCSTMTVGWRLLQTTAEHDARWFALASLLLQYALPTALSLYTTSKLYGAATFYFVQELLQEKHAQHPACSRTLNEPMCKKAMALLSQNELKKHIDKLLYDFFFSTFNPATEYCHTFLFHSAPMMFGMRPEEAIPPALIPALMTSCVSQHLAAQAQNIEALAQRDPFYGPERPDISTGFVGTRSKKEVTRERAEGGDTLPGPNEAANGIGDEQASSADVQKKIDTFSLLSGAIELSDESETFSARHADRKRSDLIVVASLVALNTNLGGLCRTSEIFNVNTLTVHHEKVVNQKDFKALSVTSEKWQNIEVVAAEDVVSYLARKKREGFAIVGVEQTAESKELQSFVFEKKTVLVLGDEAKGIPADVLNVVDVTVEIPQKGFTRSLNVHVSGSLVIYKYFEQFL